MSSSVIAYYVCHISSSASCINSMHVCMLLFVVVNWLDSIIAKASRGEGIYISLIRVSLTNLGLCITHA